MVVSGDLAEVPLQLLEELPVAEGLLAGGERVDVGEPGVAARHHLSRAVQLHRARPLGGRGGEKREAPLVGEVGYKSTVST